MSAFVFGSNRFIYLVGNDGVALGIARLKLIAFTVFKFAERARFIKPFHFARGVHITIFFCVGVNLAAFFD